MTENEIKIILNGIINNNEVWEYRCSSKNKCSTCIIGECTIKNWKPYRLGYAINPDFEYRKSVRNKMNSYNILNKLIELEKKFPKNNLYGIRNKNTNKFIAIGELGGKILYSIDCNIINAYIRNNKEDVEKVYEIASQNEDFKNDNFIDVLNDEEIKEYFDFT